MQIVDPAAQAAIFKDKSPIFRAYSKKGLSTPTYTSSLPIYQSAFYARKATDYLVRFFLYGGGTSIRSQAIPNIDIPTTWEGGSIYSIVSKGGGFSSNTYCAFAKGSKLILAWIIDSTHVDYKVSSTQGLTWGSTQHLTTDSNTSNLYLIDDYGFINCRPGFQVDIYSFDETTELFTLSESITTISNAEGGCLYSGGLQIFCSGLHFYKTTTWLNKSFPVISPLNSVLITKINDLYWFFVSYLDLIQNPTIQLVMTSDMVFYSFSPEGNITAPICYYADGIYYSANGEKFIIDTVETLLPIVKSYHFDTDGISIEFTETPNLVTDRAVVLYRGPNEDNLVASQVFYSPVVNDCNLIAFTFPQSSISSLFSQRFNLRTLTYIMQGTTYSFSMIVYVPASDTLSSLVRRLFGQNSLPEIVFDPTFVDIGFGNSVPFNFQDVTAHNVVQSLASRFFHFLAPRHDAIYFMRPFSADEPDFTLTPIDYISLETIIPNIALVLGTNSADEPLTRHQGIDINGYGLVVHNLGQHDEGDYSIISPLLVQFYSAFKSPRRVYRCRIHLAAEIGDTVQLSLTEKGLILNISETFNREHHPTWYQQITITDISSL